MAKNRIDEALAALRAAGDDGFGARHEVLERMGADLLHRPALAGQIVARLCAVPEPSPQDEDLLAQLGAGLDAARIARENGKARGQSLIDAAEGALALARGQGRMTSVHSLLLAQLWTRSGLSAPGALELRSEEVIPAAGRRVSNAAEGNALLDGLFAELIQQAEGEPLALHRALTESFPAMPPEMRDHFVAYSVGRNDPLHADLACFWLLDPTPRIRLAAARALADRLAGGDLPRRVLATLVVLRSWMPDGAARAEVDVLLKEAKRKGLATLADQAPWTVHGIRATLPDGGGAQSIGIALQSGSQRKMAMLLVKQGQGVKDAYTFPCRTARDQKSVTERMTKELGALTVTADCVRRTLSIALADGLAQGDPPVPGLIEVVRLCGFTGLRPEAKSTPELIADLVSTPGVKALAPRQREALITASEEWWDRHRIIESWFEDSDAAHAVLDKARSARSAETALWKWFDTRRDWWARILARSADVLETALHPDAAGVAACAIALLEGRDLRKIPVMLDVHEQTIEAWVRDDPDFDAGMAFADGNPEDPLPEQKGEVAALLRGTDLTDGWLDGYLTGIVIAPKVIMPNQWLPPTVASSTRSTRRSDMTMRPFALRNPTPMPGWPQPTAIEGESHEHRDRGHRQGIRCHRRTTSGGLTVFVEIEAADHTPEWRTAFAAVVEDCPEIVEIHRMAGEVDYLLKVVVTGMAAYDALYLALTQRLACRNVTSKFSMERLKATTALPIDTAAV